MHIILDVNQNLFIFYFNRIKSTCFSLTVEINFIFLVQKSNSFHFSRKDEVFLFTKKKKKSL